MKITQEVRDFAARQAATSDHPGDGLGLEREAKRSADFAGDEVAAQEGMAEMSKRYREGGNELYVGANGREHD